MVFLRISVVAHDSRKSRRRRRRIEVKPWFLVLKLLLRRAQGVEVEAEMLRKGAWLELWLRL